jgi:hypothetical protein
MTAPQDQIRHRLKMSDADIIDHFRRLGFVVTMNDLAFTTESVEDFYVARQKFWHHVGKVQRHDEHGLLIVLQVQPKANQPTRDIVVVSLGHARVVLGVLPGTASHPDLPRYAKTMAR